MRNAKGFAALIVAASAASSQAVVAFDNLGPGDTFDASSGWGIFGSATGPMALPFRIAVKFTSSSSGMLNYIQYAAGHVSGTNRLVVTLLEDNAGTLGSPIAAWSTTGYAPFYSSYGLSTVYNTLYVPSRVLTAGNSYWLLLEPDENTVLGPGTGADTEAAWNFSLSGTGPVAYSFDNGVTFQYDAGRSHRQGAFRVVLGEAAVPGPAAALPFALGLLAARRRRK